MNKVLIISIIVAVVLIIGGYFVFFNNSSSDSTLSDSTLSDSSSTGISSLSQGVYQGELTSLVDCSEYSMVDPDYEEGSSRQKDIQVGNNYIILHCASPSEENPRKDVSMHIKRYPTNSPEKITGVTKSLAEIGGLEFIKVPGRSIGEYSNTYTNSAYYPEINYVTEVYKKGIFLEVLGEGLTQAEVEDIATKIANKIN